MDTLLELIPEMRRLGPSEAIRFFDGFRTWKISYQQLYLRIGGFVHYLDQEGFREGDRLLLWGENRAQWVSVFWACLVRGVQVVPVDFHSSERLVRRIQQEVRARIIVCSEKMDPQKLDVKQLSFEQVERLAKREDFSVMPVSPGHVVQILYTSGTTGEPRGVVHRHENICANLTPIRAEINRFRRLARPFQPIRLLNLLPLSHMFGQSAGIFIPPLLGGAVVFMEALHPGTILETIRREKVSVLLCVPRLLKHLRNEVERRFELPQEKRTCDGVIGILQKWWRYRRLHARLGFKFWAFVVGGAPMETKVESFWAGLGFLILQGYGLTETSPVVSLNHPFDARRGSLGKVLAGQDVKLAPDGEILVKGRSVVTEYLSSSAEVGEDIEDGWLHTGDIGELDAEGRLYFKGRKREVIVTSEGLNVYPDDVESALRSFSEVAESLVVGVLQNHEEVVHAVLILRNPSANVAGLIGAANRKLEVHQRIRSWSLWPEEDFPRTPSTQKVKRGLVASQLPGLKKQREQRKLKRLDELEEILTRFAGRKPGEDERLAEDLGLSSLDRIELLSELEKVYMLELDEDRFSHLSTINEVREWLREVREDSEKHLRLSRVRVADSGQSPHPAPDLGEPHHSLRPRGCSYEKPPRLVELPRWTRFLPIRWGRFSVLEGVLLPAFGRLVHLTVGGKENLEGRAPPVIFAANHVSHLDTLAIFSALPLAWRYRLAPAMAKGYFQAYFSPGPFSIWEKLSALVQYYLACSLFNAYPLPQEVGGVRQALQYTGRLVEAGYCPLVYPEGSRSTDGKLQLCKPGIGLMAVRLKVPIIPVYLAGLFEIYSVHHDWPRSGNIRVEFGPPLQLDGRDYQEATREIQRAIESLAKRVPTIDKSGKVE